MFWEDIDSLWSSDTMQQHRSGSTLVQVMAWCLMAPSHCLDQCWHIINEVFWHSLEGNITRSAYPYHGFRYYTFENYYISQISMSKIHISLLAVVAESVTCGWLLLLQVMAMLWQSSSNVYWQLCLSQWPVHGCSCRWCPWCGRAPAMFVGSCAWVSDLWLVVVVAGDAHAVAELQQCLLAVVPELVTCEWLFLLQVIPMLWQSSSNVCW